KNLLYIRHFSFLGQGRYKCGTIHENRDCEYHGKALDTRIRQPSGPSSLIENLEIPRSSAPGAPRCQSVRSNCRLLRLYADKPRPQTPLKRPVRGARYSVTAFWTGFLEGNSERSAPHFEGLGDTVTGTCLFMS